MNDLYDTNTDDEDSPGSEVQKEREGDGGCEGFGSSSDQRWSPL